MNYKSFYVGYTDAKGAAQFEPLAVWAQLPDLADNCTLLRGLPALLDWCNQERAPTGALHRLVDSPHGLTVVRPHPGPGYWIAEPTPPDAKAKAALERLLKVCTKHDGIAA